MQPTLGPIVEEAATAADTGTAPEALLYLGPEISPGLPALRSVVLSVLFHGLVIAALMAIRFPVAMPPQPAQEALSPTEIRIGQHIYYVARISPPDAPQPAAKRTQAPRRKTTAAPALALRNPKLVAPAPPAPRSLPRAFIPPEVRQSPDARQTLIQPLSPPDLVPPATPLPTFRILSTQIPKFAKPFLAPGRPKPPPQIPVLATPAPMEMVHADPQPTNLRARLPLPRTPPPLDAPPVVDAPDLPPPIPVGDPVNILSLNDHNIPMTDRLVVPPGNIAQVSGEGAGAGAAAGSSAVDQTNPRASGTSASNASVSNALASSSTVGSPTGSPASGAPSGTAAGSPKGASSGSASGSGAATMASSSSPGSSSGPAGPGSVGPGTPGGVVIVGGGGGARAPRAAPGPVVITRAPTGNFDAMVVQTTPLDQYPESRGLLSGRPIYSVYISVGASTF